MKKRIVSVLLACLCAGTLFGCKKQEEQPEEVSENVVVSDTEETPVITGEIETHDGQEKSYLTGEWIDENTAALRPIAVMVGNTNEKGVLPQHGLCSADVIYEAPVEGGLTRLMLIFQDYASVEMVEPVRSCRLYFLDFASEFEAIYAHWGQAIYATEAVQAYDDLDGMSNDVFGTAFFRDSSKSAPHNGYATGEGLAKVVVSKGYEAQYSESYTGHYQFAADGNEVTLSDGEDAVVVQPGYAVNKPWFVYDEEDGLYYRYEYGQAQTDANNGEQAAVKNIILQYASVTTLDEHGYLSLDTTQDGDGMFITNGKAIPITWGKDTSSSVTHYYDTSGEEITLNQGKTWVCVVKTSDTGNVALHATKEGFTE